MKIIILDSTKDFLKARYKNTLTVYPEMTLSCWGSSEEILVGIDPPRKEHEFFHYYVDDINVYVHNKIDLRKIKAIFINVSKNPVVDVPDRELEVVFEV